MLRDLNRALLTMEKVGQRRKPFRDIHAKLMQPLAVRFRSQAPFNPSTSPHKKEKYNRSIQPYAHLKRRIRLQTLRTNTTGKIIVVNSDAFHFNFLESGTKTRAGGRGQIKGSYKEPISAIWNRTGFIKSQGKQMVEKLIRDALKDYERLLITPNFKTRQRNYRWTMRFNLPAMGDPRLR